MSQVSWIVVFIVFVAVIVKSNRATPNQNFFLCWHPLSMKWNTEYSLLHVYSIIHTKMRLKPRALLNIWAYKWLLADDIYLKNVLFHLWLPLRFYLPWLDHIKIISNHHAATCVLSTRSVGKFAEKLISCQGHFHYRGWLSLQGCYPVPVTLSAI